MVAPIALAEAGFARRSQSAGGVGPFEGPTEPAAPSAPRIVVNNNSATLMSGSLLLRVLRNNSFVSGTTTEHIGKLVYVLALNDDLHMFSAATVSTDGCVFLRAVTAFPPVFISE